MKRNFLLVTIFFIHGCSSIASSTAALAVAMHAKKIEKDTRRYKGIDRCFLSGKPVAFDIASQILSTQVANGEQQSILNPEHRNKKPYDPYYVAYAFYDISYRMGDFRAEKYKQNLLQYLDKKQAHKIEDFIEFKYLQSHLVKCFHVPHEYKIRLKDRELVEGH
jgi:hypothetical protein